MTMPTTNIRPGRSRLILMLRSVANRMRSWLTFACRYRWVRAEGMVRIPWSVRLWSPHKDIRFGHDVQLGGHCEVFCDAWFGDKVLIGRRVAFVGRDDHRCDIPGQTIWDSPRGDRFKVVVEDDVWIGHGAIVLSGVTIATGAVVGAGAVVTRDVPPYTIVGGNPARVVKPRFTEQQIAEHEKLIEEAASLCRRTDAAGACGAAIDGARVENVCQ